MASSDRRNVTDPKAIIYTSGLKYRYVQSKRRFKERIQVSWPIRERILDDAAYGVEGSPGWPGVPAGRIGYTLAHPPLSSAKVAWEKMLI